MTTFGTLRAFAPMALIATLVLTPSWFGSARDAAADCSVPYFPDLASTPQLTAGFIALPSAERGLNPGQEGVTSSVSRDGSRTDILRGEGFTLVSIARSTPQGCDRLILKADPPQLQVGIKPDSLLDAVDVPEIAPGQGRIIVKVYQDGAPAPGATVELTTRPCSYTVPHMFGSTHGHEHLAAYCRNANPAERRSNPGLGMRPLNSGEPAPSIRLEGQSYPGETVVVGPGDGAIAELDGAGQATLLIDAGYRGGIESVVATAEGGTLRRPIAGQVPVIVRHRQLVHFAQYLGYGTRGPDEVFPFILTGWSAEHNYPHWVQGQYAGKVADVLKALRTHVLTEAGLLKDEHLSIDERVGRQAMRARGEEPPQDTTPEHYINLGPMSLEYGGAWNEQSFDRGHDTGLSFDVSPCLTTDLDPVLPNVCRTDDGEGDVVKIEEGVFRSFIEGWLGGEVWVHGEDDSAPYAYHVRLPYPY